MSGPDSPALRTLLSWRRSALSLATLGAATLRLAVRRHEPVEIAGGMWMIAAAPLLEAIARRRLRAACGVASRGIARRPSEERPSEERPSEERITVRAAPGLMLGASLVLLVSGGFLVLAAVR